ncbi:hypothetical protein EU508_06370 [Pseudoalteromonas fuliginea]|uniref:Asparagine synthetase domain-containing protein n=1 Tax=Pseudoalteromonas fuliginea TaxID=1872678 RepID=A0AB73BIM7_9GAMM|nr:hypothetical protein [Pseudoalteromonas fuliginea]KAA1162031.1 hypothetical protein EU508_06370 [Pseudoalteromonas fuliginea]
MSKLIVSTNEESVRDIIDITTEAGVKLSNSSFKKYYSVASFKKINFDNENFYTCEEGAITSAGSLIYNERIGCVALKSILVEFIKHRNVKKIKQHIIGNYVLVIELEGELYIFGDSNDVFDIFYHSNKEQWTVSNSLFDASKKNSPVVSYNNLIESIFQNGILDNGTIFKNIFRLKGDEFIYVCLSDKSFNIIKHEEVKVDNVTDDSLAKSCESLANSIAKAFKDIAICMTGGLDSRLLLSSYLTCGSKPNLFYGVGNSSLTNTKKEDLDINKLIAKRFDLELNVMDWEVDNAFSCNWEALTNKVGFLSTVYSGIESVHNELGELAGSRFIDFGYFGEPFRNIEVLAESTRVSYTTEQFVDELYINQELKKSLKKVDYRDYRLSLINKVKKLCESKAIDDNQITKDDFCKIHNEYRKSADTVLINLANYYCYSINLLSLHKIETAVKTYPALEKENSKLLLKIINKLQPEILKIPIFSHCKPYTLDGTELEIKSTGGNSFKKVLKNKLRKFDVVKKAVHLFRAKKKNNGINSKVEKKLISMLDESILMSTFSKRTFDYCDLRRFSKYIQTMKIINSMKKKE